MSLKDHMQRVTSGLADVDGDLDKAAAKGRRGTGSMPASATLMHFSDDAREMAIEIEALKRDKGKAVRVAMDVCDDGPFHATPIDAGRVERLLANLRENGQNTPAVVRALPGDRFQIVAGRHRKAALQALGQTDWDVVIRDYDDDLAERLTFYDNLLAPSLPDFYKYLSFASRKEHTGKSIGELAKESGLSDALVSNLLAFGKLPRTGLETIAAHPGLFGSAFARQAAALLPEHEARGDRSHREGGAGPRANEGAGGHRPHCRSEEGEGTGGRIQAGARAFRRAYSNQEPSHPAIRGSGPGLRVPVKNRTADQRAPQEVGRFLHCRNLR